MIEDNGRYGSGGQPAGQHQHTSWQFYNGQWYAVPSQQPQQQAPPVMPRRPEKKGSPGARVVATVLACAVFGFGSGLAAYGVMDAMAPRDASQTVVYKAPETDSPTAGTVGAEAFTVSQVAANAGQSVVSITTENVVTDFRMNGQVVSGAGSGVIISEDGYIITNHHVVSGSQKISVTLPDGSEHEASLVGSDAVTDVAVIKIPVTGLVPVVLGNSDTLQVGDFCLAIGNPMGTLGGTVTDGIISALDRQINISGNEMTLLQMSAAVSPGNSGGGLFNSRGELVGVVNAKSGGEDSEGLGFAIPVNTAMDVAQDLIEHGHVTGRPGLGVLVMTISTEAEALAYGVDRPGVYLEEVNRGGAAEKAGLQAGDQIVSADGAEVSVGSDLSRAMKEKQVGDAMELVVRRGDRVFTVTVELAELNVSA